MWCTIIFNISVLSPSLCNATQFQIQLGFYNCAQDCRYNIQLQVHICGIALNSYLCQKVSVFYNDNMCEAECSWKMLHKIKPNFNYCGKAIQVSAIKGMRLFRQHSLGNKTVSYSGTFSQSGACLCRPHRSMNSFSAALASRKMCSLPPSL